MHAKSLDPSCGLFPTGVRHVTIRPLQRGWEFTCDSEWGPDKPVVLPADRCAAQDWVAFMLRNALGFSAGASKNATLLLFQGHALRDGELPAMFPETPSAVPAGRGKRCAHAMALKRSP